jgi:hypothetical protein
MQRVDLAVQPLPEGGLRLGPHRQLGERQLQAAEELDAVLAGGEDGGGAVLGEGAVDARQARLRVGVVVGEAQLPDDLVAGGARGARELLRPRQPGDQEDARAGRQRAAVAQPRRAGRGGAGETGSAEAERAEGLGERRAGGEPAAPAGAGQHHGVGAGRGLQRLAQPAAGEEAPAGEGVGRREGEEVEVAGERQVGEAVVEEEEVGDRVQPLEGVAAAEPAVRGGHHRHPRQLAGQEHRLVARQAGPQERSGAGAHQPHAAPAPAVAAGQDADREAAVAQVGGERGDERRLAGAPPVEVADRHHRPRQPARPPAVPAPPQAMGGAVEPLPGGDGGARRLREERGRHAVSGPGGKVARTGASRSSVRARAPRLASTRARPRRPCRSASAGS